MIAASEKTEKFHAGYVALTSAEDEQPFLVHVDEIQHVCFDIIGGGQPFGIFVAHRRGGDAVVETIVYEGLADVLDLIRRAAEERASLEDDDF